MTIEYPCACLLLLALHKTLPPFPPVPGVACSNRRSPPANWKLLLAVLTNLMCRRRFARGASFRAEPPRVRGFPFEIPRPAVRVALDCAP